MAIDSAIAFFMSMLPLIELRGGIAYTALKGVPFQSAFICCFLGNILPVPFILIFIQGILGFLEGSERFEKLAKALKGYSRRKSGNIQKRRLLGLFLFVALPVPGTGAWAGALIASLMGFKIREAFMAIALGVLGAGAIMSAVSFLIPGLFFSIGG